MNDIPGKAVWVGFSTGVGDEPDSLIQDTLPTPKPAPTPAPKPADTPDPTPPPKGRTPAGSEHGVGGTSYDPDVAAIMREVQYGRTKERSIVAIIGLLWFLLAVGGVATAVGLSMFDQLTR